MKLSGLLRDALLFLSAWMEFAAQKVTSRLTSPDDSLVVMCEVCGVVVSEWVNWYYQLCRADSGEVVVTDDHDVAILCVPCGRKHRAALQGAVEEVVNVAMELERRDVHK